MTKFHEMALQRLRTRQFCRGRQGLKLQWEWPEACATCMSSVKGESFTVTSKPPIYYWTRSMNPRLVQAMISTYTLSTLLWPHQSNINMNEILNNGILMSHFNAIIQNVIVCSTQELRVLIVAQLSYIQTMFFLIFGDPLQSDYVHSSWKSCIDWRLCAWIFFKDFLKTLSVIHRSQISACQSGCRTDGRITLSPQ